MQVQFKKLQRIIAEKRGISTIEFIIAFLIFIMLFSFIFDLVIVTYNQYKIGEQVTQVAKQIGKQGSVKDSSSVSATFLSRFPGGAENYFSKQELVAAFESKLGYQLVDSPDPEDGQCSVSVKAHDTRTGITREVNLVSGNHIYDMPYGGRLEVNAICGYEWNLWSQLVPGTPGGKITASRGAFVEYNSNLNLED